jgi:hypothetical protein
MPPTGEALTEKQVSLLRTWIAEGAKWDQHWAYVPPTRPAEPVVRNRTWARNPIDRFVLARLEKEGIAPSAAAERHTLLRRLSLDLTGLPPSPEELQAFQRDRSPQALARQIDRLLASPHFGERMAIPWLDLSRYADTHGFHIDSHRDMWRWRDWVIQAFNQNKPFSAFTVEQIAGDLLPDAKPEQILATGFNRNHMINFEGGAIPEEYQAEYLVDRVDTTATVWMGMTMGCSRCHDHKYDPISQKDFYRFAAFFNGIPERGLDGIRGNAAPVLAFPSPEQKQREAFLSARIPELEKALEAPAVKSAYAAWQQAPVKLPASLRDGLLAHYEFDGSLSDATGNYRHGRNLLQELNFPASRTGDRALQMNGRHRVELPMPDAFQSIAFWIQSQARMDPNGVLYRMDDQRRGWEIVLDEPIAIGRLRQSSHIVLRRIEQWPGKVQEFRTKLPVLFKDTSEQIYFHFATNGPQEWYVNGQRVEVVETANTLSKPWQEPALPLTISGAREADRLRGRMDDLRIYSRPLRAEEYQALVRDSAAGNNLYLPASQRSKDQETQLLRHFLRYTASEDAHRQFMELEELRAEKASLEWEIPTAMVMKEMEKPRDTYVLARGDYRNQAEKVTPGIPSVLPPLPPGVKADRLALARWLVDPKHPLTARVAVNRFWQIFFGVGLVKTTEDFGSQGEPPSHPELLDWLAVQFVESGWDVKALVRLIVNSATWQQRSQLSAQLRERDPENRLLARGPRFRLAAELMRDSALASAGLLNRRSGGPSVSPYQPSGLWEELAYGAEFSAQTFRQSQGEDVYRRSLYTFWKRTSPPAMLSIFDAPDREKCTARRAVTNTPLQALAMMNDPTYVEASRVLAQRVLREAPDTKRRIERAFLLTTARMPAAQELALLTALVNEKLRDYNARPEEAARLTRVGDSAAPANLPAPTLAAWTVAMNAILNLDEVLTRE